MTSDDIFKWLIKECHLTVEDYANLNDRQIEVLISQDRGDQSPSQG